MHEINNNEHNVGIELLRIVAMLMIVLLHLICHTFTDDGGTTRNIMAYLFLRAVTLVCVECYAMISGFVMVYSKPRYSRLLCIWLQMMFYAVGICIVFRLAGLTVPRSMWIWNFHPVTARCYWYLTAYFGMYVLLPFVLPTLKNMPLKSLMVTGGMLFFFYSCLAMLNGRLFGIESGYSTIWLLVCFIWGAAIRRAQDAGQFQLSSWILLLCLALILIVFMVNACLTAFHPHLFSTKINEVMSKLCREYYSPLTVLYAVILLGLFTRMKIGSQRLKAVILWFSPLTLGVYLIHCHRCIWLRYIKLDEKLSIANYSVTGFVLRLLGIGLGVYLAASCVDFLRLELFKWLKIKQISEKICHGLDGCL